AGFFSKDDILARTFARGHEAPLFYLFWALGAVGALLTAFYMTRLMAYAFHGPNRTGEREREHLHEAPWVMTGPLVVLALGAVAAGAINLPEVLPGHEWLARWLEPVTFMGGRYLVEGQLGAATEWTLLALAAGIAAIGMIGAWQLLKPAVLKPAREAPAETGIQRVLLRKYYVDEIYDTLLVRPLAWLSDRVLWKTIDAFIIDGVAVNGVARVARLVGWVGSRLQTGQVGTYVVIFVLGTIVLLRALLRS
ncbi:MAG: NADH-quinone oxidoreductase subunit L, partial [Gemmatimonadetes bacterium]|nr:NADH-quinone oxidoreductase subunit L [Gemmatimonadota bacterium]